MNDTDTRLPAQPAKANLWRERTAEHARRTKGLRS